MNDIDVPLVAYLSGLSLGDSARTAFLSVPGLTFKY